MNVLTFSNEECMSFFSESNRIKLLSPCDVKNKAKLHNGPL